ncbi:Plant lipid transfer protein/Par allergen [Corchorus olitorius]|uniref:Plant lipid transfer protein/Par allergen n=1 Tax=Corchorus olitorius TaxID=93759 RepID=A0A1R3KDC4_9ROSI|nr:Plant lipid transfer protein/Par allergen [Corchorus olitorius]
MAIENVKLGFALILVGMFCYEATAQSGCTSALLGLAPCLNYITGNSTTPSSSCCSQLSSVVQSQPQCLCSALNGGGSSFGITINQTQALSLPGACNVQTPPVSRCNGANGPAPAAPPAESPSGDTSDETPDTPDTSSMPTIPSGKSNLLKAAIISILK